MAKKEEMQEIQTQEVKTKTYKNLAGDDSLVFIPEKLKDYNPTDTDVNHVLLERVNYDNLGRRTSMPFVQKFGKNEFAKMMSSGDLQRLGYNVIVVLSKAE